MTFAADRLGIEFISGLGMPPAGFVELAARLGCGAIGLALSPITADPLGGAVWSLRDDPALRREVRAALIANGVRISLGEGFLIRPGASIADAQADIALLVELGALRLNTCVLEPDAPRAAAEFASFARTAAAYNLPVTVEFLPGMPIGTLAQALALLRAADAPNAGVLVDAMHLLCGGDTPEGLAAVDPALITYAQLCDASKAAVGPDYFDIARNNRLGPGEGVLPLAAFIAALRPQCPIGLEVPMGPRALAGLDAEARLAPCVAAARRLMEPRT